MNTPERYAITLPAGDIKYPHVYSPTNDLHGHDTFQLCVPTLLLPDELIPLLRSTEMPHVDRSGTLYTMIRSRHRPSVEKALANGCDESAEWLLERFRLLDARNIERDGLFAEHSCKVFFNCYEIRDPRARQYSTHALGLTHIEVYPN